MSESAFLAKLQRRLEALTESCDGVAGVQIIDLATGDHLGVNADLIYATASSIKVPLLVSMYRKARAGELDLGAPVVIDRRHAVGGSGVLQLFDHPVTLALEDLATLMINVSDNVATNAIIDLVGMDYVNRQLDELGLGTMRLCRKMIDNAAAARGAENVSSLADAAELMRMLWAGEIVDRQLCDDVLRILRKPKRQSPVALLLPQTVEIANKPGGLDGVSCEFAVVCLRRRPYVFCAAVNYAVPPADPAALVARLSLETYRFFAVLDRGIGTGRMMDPDVLAGLAAR
jgi:beta-lactamase class A